MSQINEYHCIRSAKVAKQSKITIFDKKGRSSKEETCLAPVS